MSCRRTEQNPGMFSVSWCSPMCFRLDHTCHGTTKLWCSEYSTYLTLHMSCMSVARNYNAFSVSQPFLTQVSCAHVVVMIPGNSLIFHWLLCIAACHQHVHWHHDVRSICEDDSIDTRNFATPLESDDDVSDTGFLGCVQENSNNAVWSQLCISHVCSIVFGYGPAWCTSTYGQRSVLWVVRARRVDLRLVSGPSVTAVIRGWVCLSGMHDWLAHLGVRHG